MVGKISLGICVWTDGCFFFFFNSVAKAIHTNVCCDVIFFFLNSHITLVFEIKINFSGGRGGVSDNHPNDASQTF